MLEEKVAYIVVDLLAALFPSARYVRPPPYLFSARELIRVVIITEVRLIQSPVLSEVGADTVSLIYRLSFDARVVVLFDV